MNISHILKRITEPRIQHPQALFWQFCLNFILKPVMEALKIHQWIIFRWIFTLCVYIFKHFSLKKSKMTKLAGSFFINKFLKPTLHEIAWSLNSSITTSRDWGFIFKTLAEKLNSHVVFQVLIHTRMFLKLADTQQQNEADMSSEWPMI